jgi:hypothetical protein
MNQKATHKLWYDKHELLAEYRKINPAATLTACMRAVIRHKVIRMYARPSQSRPQRYSVADWQRVLSTIKPRVVANLSAEQGPPPEGWHSLRAIARAAGTSQHRVIQWAERGCFPVHYHQHCRYAEPAAVVFALSWRRLSFARKHWSKAQIAKRLAQQSDRGLTPPPGVPYPADQCLFAPELLKLPQKKRK